MLYLYLYLIGTRFPLITVYLFILKTLPKQKLYIYPQYNVISYVLYLFGYFISRAAIFVFQ